MKRARKREESPEERRRRWGEFWGKMLMVSILTICVPWMAYFWERTTGVTVSTSKYEGRNSSTESLARTFNTAFAMTIVALPLLLLSLTKRREYL